MIFQTFTIWTFNFLLINQKNDCLIIINYLYFFKLTTCYTTKQIVVHGVSNHCMDDLDVELSMLCILYSSPLPSFPSPLLTQTPPTQSLPKSPYNLKTVSSKSFPWSTTTACFVLVVGLNLITSALTGTAWMKCGLLITGKRTVHLGTHCVKVHSCSGKTLCTSE